MWVVLLFTLKKIKVGSMASMILGIPSLVIVARLKRCYYVEKSTIKFDLHHNG